ncbi:MAG: FGGY-family carbohydrate kinase [Chloroflexi bacterium]|nr:FGGY-family carbohydrate kinase [Chloroflexota bacterium]
MAEYVLGLDVGTSSAHCLLVNHHGEPLGGNDAPITYYCPPGCSPLAREFNPRQVMDTMGCLVRETCRQAGIASHEVAALGITSQRQGMVLLEDTGREVYCGPNVDLRSVFEGAALDEEAGPEIYQTTGYFPSMMLAPARLRWFRSHQPETLANASSLLSVAGWLAYRLTGEKRGGEGLDDGLGLVDLSTRQHATCLLEKLCFPIDLVPPLSQSGEQIGKLLPDLAECWGLPAGVPVTLAGADSQCGLLGLGLDSAGDAGAVLGWSGSVHMLTCTPAWDFVHQRSWVGCYPIGGLYTAEANLGDAGLAWSWLMRTVGGPDLSYEKAEELAQEVSPGCDGVLSFLGPSPLSAPRAGLRLGGIIMPTPLTFQETTPAQMLRSYLESVAYSIKSNLDAVSELVGQTPPVFYFGGRFARSEVLAAALANLLAVPVYRSRESRVSAAGAAAAAWVAAGRFATLEEAVAEPGAGFDIALPEPVATAEYQEHYQRWLSVYEKLSPLS